jgi:hypothetical protein
MIQREEAFTNYKTEITFSGGLDLGLTLFFHHLITYRILRD